MTHSEYTSLSKFLQLLFRSRIVPVNLKSQLPLSRYNSISKGV
jgi:hypothetical protein